MKNEKYEEAYDKYTESINLHPGNKKLNSTVYSNRAITWQKRK
jgi:hypothetical protein